LPGLTGCDAIGKAFERFRGGNADGVALLYERIIGMRLGGAGVDG
jgi:hypothetical protein